jgi:prepilin-type N-terminal cleavage/methylation domain-containing protein
MISLRDERGFTLAELLAAFSVLALVLAAATTIHHDVLQAYVVGSNKTEVQQNARVALERIARELRQTPAALTSATGTSLRLRDQDTGLDVTYALAGALPNQTLTRTTNGVADVVIGKVLNLLFTYRDVANNVLAVPVGTPASIFRVDITIQTGSEEVAVAGGVADVGAELTTSVRLRNL